MKSILTFLRFQLNMGEKRLCLNGQNIVVLSPPSAAALCSAGESHVEKEERMVNLLFQETSNLLLGANVTSQKPVLRKAGVSVLFLVSVPPPPSCTSSSPALLFLSSSPLSIPLLFWGGLLSPLKHPCAHRYYWGLTVHLNTPVCADVCQSVCVCVCESLSEREQARWSDSAWQTGFVIQYFKFYSPYTILPSYLFTAAFGIMKATATWVHSL